MRRIPNFWKLAALFLIGAALLLSACGGSSSSKTTTSSGGVTTIQFGYVPYTDDAPLFLGIEKGFFTKHGLNVQPVPAASPAPIVANLVSGHQQFGFVTTNVLAAAVAHDVPIQCVSSVDGNESPTAKTTPLLAAPGSGITSLKQLGGKTVAVVQLNSLNSVDVQEEVALAGGNPNSVHLISVPFPQMPQALKSGRVAAAVIVAPFAITAIQEGARPIAYPTPVLFPNGTVTCVASSTSYIKSNPQQVKAWQAAVNESAEYAKTHLAAARATLVKYLHLTPAAAQKAQFETNFDTTINTASVQKQETLLKEFGALPTVVSVNKLFYAP